jgi:predicted HTH transcriptional regulator
MDINELGTIAENLLLSGPITNTRWREARGIPKDKSIRASMELARLVKLGKLRKEGMKRGAKYLAP